MNAISFFLLNKIYNPRELDTTYLEDLYQYYESVSQELGYDINLKKEEFQDVIRVIFSVLSLRISDEDFGTVIENYIKLLTSIQSFNRSVRKAYLGISIVKCERDILNRSHDFEAMGITSDISESEYFDKAIMMAKRLSANN